MRRNFIRIDRRIPASGRASKNLKDTNVPIRSTPPIGKRGTEESGLPTVAGRAVSIWPMKTHIYVAVVMAGLSAIAQSQRPTDWTQWRGASRDGIIASFTPPQTWPDALIRRWSVEIGTG